MTKWIYNPDPNSLYSTQIYSVTTPVTGIAYDDYSHTTITPDNPITDIEISSGGGNYYAYGADSVPHVYDFKIGQNGGYINDMRYLMGYDDTDDTVRLFITGATECNMSSISGVKVFNPIIYTLLRYNFPNGNYQKYQNMHYGFPINYKLNNVNYIGIEFNWSDELINKGTYSYAESVTLFKSDGTISIYTTAEFTSAFNGAEIDFTTTTQAIPDVIADWFTLNTHDVLGDMQIILYNNSAEINRVDKGNYLSIQTTLTGTLRDECDILKPSIVFEFDSMPTFNYAYIPLFHRYYTVTGKTVLSNKLYEIQFDCDVLYTYKNAIKSLQALVARNEFTYNSAMPDNNIPCVQNKNTTIYSITNNVFSKSIDRYVDPATGNAYNPHTFVLNTVGGGISD